MHFAERVLALGTEVERRLGYALPDFELDAPPPITDHVGVEPQKEPGLVSIGVPVKVGLVSGEQLASGGMNSVRGYLAAEMETAAVYLLAMRDRAKGRPIRAGTILTVSDVIRDPGQVEGTRKLGDEDWYRPPEEEVTRRVDLTIGAALAAAAALGR